MALDPKIGTAARNAACNGVVDLVDAGPGAGYVQIRTGAPPATPAAASTGTLLAQLAFADPAFGNSGAVNPGEAIANAIPSQTAVGTGDAGYYRVYDSTGSVVYMQGTAGVAGDTPDMVFDDKSFVTGGTVTITSFKVTMPEQ